MQRPAAEEEVDQFEAQGLVIVDRGTERESTAGDVLVGQGAIADQKRRAGVAEHRR